MSFQVPEKFRVKTGTMATTARAGNNGLFNIPLPHAQQLRVIASDGGFLGEQVWEHVSVSRQDRCPTWEEMCAIKSLFWIDPEDCVVQYHPPRSDYVNCHPFCLHLWRPVGITLPRPPSLMVGPT